MGKINKLHGRVFLGISILLSSIALNALDIANAKNNYGVNILDIKTSNWKSKAMDWPEKIKDKDRVWNGEDFFQYEYGHPLVFTKDWIKEYGFSKYSPYKISNGALTFKTGKKGFIFGFGNIKDKKEIPGILFGGNWIKNKKDRYRLKMELEQNVEKSDWVFNVGNYIHQKVERKDFSIKGKGPQIYEIDLGYARNVEHRHGATGISFKCDTPNAEVKIKNISIAPSTAEIFFRRKFNLEALPVKAFASFECPETWELYINGKEIDHGDDKYQPGTIKSVNILPWLKKGKNAIAFRKDCFNWQGRKSKWLIEGAFIFKDGKIKRLLGDEKWKCSITKTNGWMNVAFDDSKWKAPALSSGIRALNETYLPDGRTVFTGVDPKHMGLLDVSPANRQYPVFEYTEKPQFTLSLPIGAKGKYKPEVAVTNLETKKELSVASKATSIEKGNFIVYSFSFAPLETGPYRLDWKLLDKNGKIVEMRSDEMISVGPLKQDEVELSKFDDELKKRLKLVQNIDCSKLAANGEFMDHSGMYSSPITGNSIVVSNGGMNYRETGKGLWDYYSYRLHLPELGKPYLVEIIVPDDKSRYIYSGVVEQYPHWNFFYGKEGRFASSGSCLTGTKYPLTNKKRKLSYIYYPGSKNAGVVIMSGFIGAPAAACEINVYKVEGGLPALRVPETKRMFGSFSERPSLIIPGFGSAEQPLMNLKRMYRNGNRNAWWAWYEAVKRKIEYLRFNGKNMAGEGIFMYNEGDYPSLKHNTAISNQGIDPFLLMIKMYNHNKIKCMLGMQYHISPKNIACPAIKYASDRKVRKGTNTQLLVDRHGRQLYFSRGGTNFLEKKAAKLNLELISEIYKRYSKAGKIAGFVMVLGNAGGPGFIDNIFRDIVRHEIGYGNVTAGIFEKDTGIKLGIAGNDPKRFQKRFELLTNKYKNIWFKWRKDKLCDFLSKIAKLLKTGSNSWKLYTFSYPSTRLEFQNLPFVKAEATRSDRNKYIDNFFDKAGIDINKTLKNKINIIAPLLNVQFLHRSPDANMTFVRGFNANAGMRQLIKKTKAVFLKTMPMDEVDCPAGAVKNWLWQRTWRGVFVLRGVEGNCMNEFVNSIAYSIPETIIDSWLDMNLETGFGPQMRRFCKSFYVTPEQNFIELPAKDVKGVIAQTAGDGSNGKWVRLVNNTPYKLNGCIETDASSVRDLVYNRELSSGLFNCRHEISMPPNEILILYLKGGNCKVKCDFSMPEKAAQKIKAKVCYLLSKDNYLQKIPGDIVAALFKNMKKDDAFALYNLLENFEVSSKIRQAEKEKTAIDNHKKFLHDLDSKGRGRIICASPVAYSDPHGNRWLPDQKFIVKEAYGNDGANYADRGILPIENTEIDRVYQTEAYGGHVIYRIPVPDGKYNVYLHFSETFVKNKKPGLRKIIVKAEGRPHPETIDPFALSGGFAKPYVLELKDVKVDDDMIDVELSGGVGINGIEVEKASE